MSECRLDGRLTCGQRNAIAVICLYRCPEFCRCSRVMSADTHLTLANEYGRGPLVAGHDVHDRLCSC